MLQTIGLLRSLSTRSSTLRLSRYESRMTYDSD